MYLTSKFAEAFNATVVAGETDYFKEIDKVNKRINIEGRSKVKE